jgi:hypothetical protein
MTSPISPNRIQESFKFVNTDTGRLTPYGIGFLNDLWRQLAAGFVIVPCQAATAANVITLTPIMNSEGGATYGDYMWFSFIADVTSTGAVTANVVGDRGSLTTIKVLKADGASQAGAGDIVINSLYLLGYGSGYDGGLGAFVLK